jgi:hypothetical protein
MEPAPMRVRGSRTFCDWTGIECTFDPPINATWGCVFLMRAQRADVFFYFPFTETCIELIILILPGASALTTLSGNSFFLTGIKRQNELEIIFIIFFLSQQK